ncbi:uncharacterized protein [Sinocyclocheilus grahami]|uniref:uncharacterized protein n=1 Tax=Sinocyclocheilus grahami TaxID=75366 RepID=UPI0007AC8F4A|nr:PREDICTED: uncharacterized protein LOC107551753 [Sinocyclocheilus grahami]
MPMLSEFTKSFLTTSPLLNATTNAVTLTSLSETQNPAPTAFVSQSTKITVSLATTETTAPTIIFVTQETTMPLSTSATGASQITSVTPMTTSGVKTSIPINSAATIASTQTTAAVASKLLFNSWSPVPSESQVMSAINTLLISRESQLSESVKVVNVTYEKISETSYAVFFTFHVVNISMPEDPDLRGDTYQQVKDIINDALNTLLNEPGKIVFEPKSSNFTSSSNQIDGRMDYTFQDGDAIQPVSFLNELRLPTTTTVLPETTTGFTVTPSNLIPGSAVVTSKLVFNSSSPVPSEALVLSAINTLRNSRESQLSESVQVVNVTYEKVSESSYAVILKFYMSGLSMPRDSGLRNNIYLQVQDTINKALNTLLNEPSSPALQPISSNFKSTFNQIEGSMEYNFQDADVIKPVKFLQALSSLTVLTTASTLTSSITSPQTLLGKAYINIRLVFHTLGPIPSKDYIINLASSTLNPRYRTKVVAPPTQGTSLVDIGYTKLNETSYALTFGFEITNISMSEKRELRNETYTSIKSTINKLLVDILKDPSASQFDLQHIAFDGNSTVILASVQYVFSESDLSINSAFVKEMFKAKEVLTTASTLTSSITSPQTLLGKAYINIRLVFHTLGPIPSKDYIINLASSTLNPRYRTKVDAPPTQGTSLVDIGYTKLNETSYALTFEFEITNISMSEKRELRNETYTSIKSTINKLLVDILKDPSASQFDLQHIAFDGNSTVILASVQYVFSESDLSINSPFVKEMFKAKEDLTTASTLTISTSPPNVLGKVIIYISLVFKTRGTIPSESNVVNVANTLLSGMKLRMKRSLTTKDLTKLVNFVNVTYTKIDDNSFSLNFGFEISNVSMSERVEFRNETFTVIQDYINTFVSKILNKTTTTYFNFNQINFKGNSSVIEANVQYVFTDSDIDSFGLVSAFLGLTTTATPTTYYPTVLTSTILNNSTNVAWIVAIIVPCAIVIGLVPCWILLCCLLCGCCAAIRKRWHRRRSYNVQYTTRNSIF